MQFSTILCLSNPCDTIVTKITSVPNYTSNKVKKLNIVSQETRATLDNFCNL